MKKAQKVLVIGMNPSHKPTPTTKLNPTFRNLESWMTHLGVTHFSFINTFDSPGKASLSKVDFDSLKTACASYNKVIALGEFASLALSKINVDHFKAQHPSPLNRNLNDKEFVRVMLKNCSNYIRS